MTINKDRLKFTFSVWVEVLDSLELFAPGNSITPWIQNSNLNEDIRRRVSPSMQYTLNELQSGVDSQIWSALTSLFDIRPLRHELDVTRFANKETLRHVLESVAMRLFDFDLFNLVVCDNSIRRPQLLNFIETVEDMMHGNVFLYTVALCEKVRNTPLHKDNNTCRIDNSQGIWKKSKKKYNYGVGNTYTKCAYKASWTLILCLGLAILSALVWNITIG